MDYNYFSVKFFQGENPPTKRSKSYIYKTKSLVKEGMILDSFAQEGKSQSDAYNNKAIVTGCDPTDYRGISIKAVTIFASHFSETECPTATASEDSNLINPTDRYDGTQRETGPRGDPGAFGPPPLELPETFSGFDLQKSLRSGQMLYCSSSNGHVTIIDKKEKKTMNMNSIFNSLNIDFGAIEDGEVAYSVKGVAVRDTDGSYKAYDPDQETVTDVSGLILEGLPLIKVPVAIDQIAVGDIIFHQNIPMIVREVKKNPVKLLTVDVSIAEEKTVLPVKNIFGFDFYTKVINPFGQMFQTPDSKNPFGAILPFMLLSKDKGEQNDSLTTAMLMMSLGGMDNMNNMLPLLLLNGENGMNKDALAMMMLMNGGSFLPTVTPIPTAD